MPISNTTLLKSTYLRVFYIIVIPEGQKVPLWSVPSKNEGCRNGVRVRVPHRHVDHCENPKLRQNRLQCKVRPINETWCVTTCSIFSDSIDMFCTSTWLKKAGKFDWVYVRNCVHVSSCSTITRFNFIADIAKHLTSTFQHACQKSHFTKYCNMTSCSVANCATFHTYLDPWSKWIQWSWELDANSTPSLDPLSMKKAMVS